jgi:pimeloyl-ACP methyl ester carboxylesterase
MSAIILRDEIIHYEVLGRGRPIIFLHDWVGSWRYWIPTMQAASLAFRTYALDLWGFGDSAKNPSYYSIEQQLNLLEEFLEELGIGKIALVGHGFGAILAALYATRHPGDVDRLMVISLPNSEDAISPRLRASSPVELADWLIGRTTATESAWVEASKADPKAIQLSLVSIQNVDLAKLLEQISAPCLLVSGIEDPAILPNHTEQAVTLPEHMHQILFEGSGHYPMLDEPAKFNRLLIDFLSLPSNGSPRQLQIKEEWKRRVR